MASEQEQDSMEFRCGICGERIAGPLNRETSQRIVNHGQQHATWGDRAGE